ncbi:SCO family protein [Halovivax cerinus]|uniref:SCO family protein n=1 Tax=Halovivax cerinus TaxID=1487865 RepID=A0ABD5NQQ2_9EURY|nr:SCO family protein [Halovivax cerinus]
MHTTQSTIDRRTVLRSAGATAIGGTLAGCLGRGERASTDLILAPPEGHERAKTTDVPHPIYGDELPSATVPAPLQDRSVTTTGFVGARHTMLTFVFTSCTTVCPGLTATIRRVQADAAERGDADEIVFQAITFDPEYDTGPVLREYGRDLGVDFDAGNWYFLRPESPARARAVVDDTFGVAFERVDGADSTDQSGDDPDGGEPGDGDETGGNHTAESTNETSHTAETTNETDGGHGAHARHFVHTSLVLLVNRAGLVERAYTGGPPAPQTVRDDARAVVEGW